MIQLGSVTFRYKSEARYAIKAASCTIDTAGISAIVGRSGVGKSTLLALLAGIFVEGDPAVEELRGNILIDGLRPADLRGAHMTSWVPQTAALLDHLNIIENVMLPLRVEAEGEEAYKSYQPRCQDLLMKLEMSAQSADRPRQLSGGMKTRASLARALVSKPQYLFLDEPFASLDVGVRWSIYRLISQERRAHGFCTVMTTHNVPEAMLLADRVVVMTKSGDATVLEGVQNDRMSLVDRVDECLVEARRRARYIESRIFAEG